MSNDYSSFKVVDLKKELKTRGLSTAGNKDELVERLNTYTHNLLGSGSDIDGFAESIAENDILDEDVLGEELDYEEDVLKKSTDLEFSSHNDSSGLDMPVDVSVSSDTSALNVTVIANNDQPLPQRETQRNLPKGEKKVHLIRNRSLSLLSDADLKENNKTEKEKDEDTKERRCSSGSCVKIKTKPSQSTDNRLEQRKRRFGLLQEDDKKAARAARFGLTESNEATGPKKVVESANVLRQRAERFGLSVPNSTSTSDKDVTSLEKLKSRAERFGAVVSPVLNKLTEQEKMQMRKNRFLSSTAFPSLEEKKKQRAERFNIKT